MSTDPSAATLLSDKPALSSAEIPAKAGIQYFAATLVFTGSPLPRGFRAHRGGFRRRIERRRHLNRAAHPAGAPRTPPPNSRAASFRDNRAPAFHTGGGGCSRC